MERPERQIRAWLESFVIGLDLCPFARPLQHCDSLRICLSAARSASDRHKVFLQELDLLQTSSEQELATTLLAFPDSLASFDDFLDFLDEAQALVEAAGLEGVIQLASFHPLYQFEGTQLDDPENFSNRSPYPILHFLRENMLTRSLTEFPQPELIPQRNIATLEELGEDALRSRWQKLFSDYF
ncbi:MAG: hypothetical protein ACJAUG_000005 [Halioglobus sp.]